MRQKGTIIIVFYSLFIVFYLKRKIVLNISVMPATYKKPRVCECGYKTSYTSNWSTHKKSCKHQALKQSEAASELNALRARIDEKDARINQMEVQLAA